MKSIQLRGVAYLIIATAIQIFVGGKWNYFLAPWIALPLFIHFARSQSQNISVWIGYIPYALATAISMAGLVPLPLPLYWVFIVMMTFLLYFGFHLDRWSVRHANSAWSLLVYPAYLVSLEGMVSLGPYGTWNSLAYTQECNLPLVQIVSITGIWSIPFIMGTTASVLSRVWSERFSQPSVMKLLLPLTASLIVIHAAGSVRIRLYAEKETVSIGTCNTSAPGGRTLQNIVVNFVQQGSPAGHGSIYKPTTRATQRELLDKTRLLANLNARIVFWPEANSIVFEDDEQEFTDSLMANASEKQIFILAPMAVIHYGNKLITNKVVMVSPGEGKIGEYIKSIIPPGEPSLKGNGELKMVDFPWGRLSTAICFDMDFPGLIRQSGKLDANIVIVPALDWEEIAHVHAAMAKFRAIENGFSMIRYAEGGLHSVVNPLGQTLHLSVFNQPKDRVNVAEVPTNRIDTIYTSSGDWFLYCCVSGLMTLLFCTFRKKPVEP